MFGLMMALQRSKHVATLSPNKAVVFSETAAARNRTHRLPFKGGYTLVKLPRTVTP
jgi:hypothetical protein